MHTIFVLYWAHLCMKFSLGISNFLEEISSFPFDCFTLFLCTDHLGRLSYHSLLFFGTLHSDGYISFSPLPLVSLLLSAMPPQPTILPFCISFFLEDGLVIILCTMSQTPVHSSSGTLSDIIPWIYLSLPLYNHKGFCLQHTWLL